MKTPTLRRHQSGNWFVHWNGRARYFGKNLAAAQEKYLNDQTDGLPAWLRWRQEQAASKQRMRQTLSWTVSELRERFLNSRLREGGDQRCEFYRKHTRRFHDAFGCYVAAQLRVIHLQAVKDQMIEDSYSAVTINHDIQSVKTMFGWACDLEMLPPINLRGCKKLPVGETLDKSTSRAAVLKMIGKARGNLKAWLAMCYLCALRPIEAVRIANGQGEWVQRGVMRIPNKARGKVRIARHVLFSAEALHWWRAVEPRWSRLDSFSSACRRDVNEGGVGQSPHRLRHSAATHLQAAQVRRDDVDMILGHYPQRVSLVYMQPHWRRLRRLAARLSLVD